MQQPGQGHLKQLELCPKKGGKSRLRDQMLLQRELVT